MKKLMMDIQWDAVKCHLCHPDKEPEPIKLRGKELVDGQFGYAVHPVICDCGLVFLSPRWSKKDFDIFYRFYYDDLYRLETRPDYGFAGVVKNMKTIWSRIQQYFRKANINILDIGCGSGYGLKFLKGQLPGASIFGIESSPQCCKILQEEVGAVLITDDMESDWVTEYKNTFNLIILRHAIEHMLDPIESLKQIKSVLCKGGFIYISTPDMMKPRIILRDYTKWWEYWFRPVHPYYYSNDTLFKTLEFSGLFPKVYGNENEEIWCLVNTEPTSSVSLQGLYRKQMEVLNEYLRLR